MPLAKSASPDPGGATAISSAPSTTWLLVRMKPWALAITPEPRLIAR